MTSHAQSDRKCYECGAFNRPQNSYCWLCKKSLQGATTAPATSQTAAEVAQPPAGDVPVWTPEVVTVEPNMPPQFGLSSFMLAITGLCLLFGAFAIAPGLGILLAMVLVPALIRTVIVLRRPGRTPKIEDKILAFMASLGIVILVWVGVCVAFFIACTAVLFSQ